jgi:hypothetical protein
MSGKISQYTEALSVANDDFFDVSIDTGGGVYATRKVRKSNLGIGGGNTIYTSDDSLTGNRIVNLLSYSLDFNGGATHFDDTSAVGKITIASIDRAVFSHKNHLDTTNYALLQTENGITVLNAVSGQNINFNVGNVTHASLFSTGDLSIGNSSASARLHVKSSFSTSATTTVLFENDLGTDLLKLDDDGTFELKNGTYTNFYAQGSTNRLSMGMGATTDPTAYLTIRNANGNTNGLLLQDASGNDMAWLGGAFTAFFHSGFNDDYHLFTNSAGITKFEQYHNSTNIMAFRSNGTSFMSGGFVYGDTVRDASSIVEMESTTQGFLPPRMTTTQKNAISTPATGLVVYDSTLNKLCVYTGASWETVTSA